MKPVLVPTTDVNSETAIVTRWQADDRSAVATDDVVAEVETSKAVIDVPAPEAGYLLRVVEAGGQIRVMDPIAYLFEDLDALERHARELDERKAAAASSDAAGAPRATAPAVQLAAELGVDLSSIEAEGLITAKAVEAAAQAAGGGLPAETPSIELPDPVEADPGLERVLLIGAGLGAAQAVDIFAMGGTQTAVGLVDDDTSKWGKRVAGVPVVGGGDRVESLYEAGTFDAALITISTSQTARRRFRELCARAGIKLANAIDPAARISTGVQMGTGNMICPFCRLGTGTTIGDNNFFSAYTSFDHHNELGSDISTGPGCMTSGLVKIGDGVIFGTGVFVEPMVEIGSGVQVASGAVILTSVPPDHAVKTRLITTTVVPIRK